jgi:hypothetical protein
MLPQPSAVFGVALSPAPGRTRTNAPGLCRYGTVTVMLALTGPAEEVPLTRNVAGPLATPVRLHCFWISILFGQGGWTTGPTGPL